MDKEPLFKCRGKCGQMLPESAYPKSGPYKGKWYRRSWCKECANRRRWVKRRVPLVTIKSHLLEIVHRTGSERAAARELGIRPTQLRHWLGKAYRYRKDGSKKYAVSISRSSAAHILNTLRQLRANDVSYDHGNRKGKKPYWFSHDDRDAEYRREYRKRDKAA